MNTSERALLSKPASSYDIIVADDERPIAECIAEVLSEEGYRVRVVHDGASALQAILQHRPRLALLDIGMPVMNGDEVLAVAQRKFPDLPVILMSAGERLAGFLDQGAAGVLAKPFDFEQLLACISAHIRPPSAKKLALGDR